jgi:tetratricopeptide (TPR) repeat protein
MDIIRLWRKALLGAFSFVCLPYAAEAQGAGQAGAAQAKIVALQGQVQRTPAQQDVWNPAKLFEELFTQNRVRTLEVSRTAILFVDETQVKLNANAILTIEAVRKGTGAPSTLDLVRGEGWFRTKNPASGLTIRTPSAAAAIRGTEINVALAADGATVLTVVEGSAQLSNDSGSLLVNAGEEGTARPGQTPTKRVILNPEDAVQWALYYPTRVSLHDLPAVALSGPAGAVFDQLAEHDPVAALAAYAAAPAADPWARIAASIAYVEQGEPEQARSVLTGIVDPSFDIERRTQVAAAALAGGDVAGARSELSAALAVDSGALRPLVLLSMLELTQNHPELARQAATRALDAHPDAVSPLIAAAEASQALFDLPQARRYLDRAVAIDPSDASALVDRARILFGSGSTAEARRDVEQAASLAPNDAQVLSLRGFILLADGDLDGATSRFEDAIEADPELGEPHLGLGLVYFKRSRDNEGLLEMLTATLLEPKISLYQSYLGKAYYQTRRFTEGLAALNTAKRLDPRDPTPWLYSSFFLRDLNRQTDALNELRHAIGLNDNRAVYRSRLLLDRDLATKNVSLAEVYRQLGMNQWGAFEAQNSLEEDFTNASAHLFASETYSLLPDRTQAFGSEQLQYFLYSPVNRNSFNNFDEYTALLDQPVHYLAPTAYWGNLSQARGVLVSRSGNDRFAHVAAIDIGNSDVGVATLDKARSASLEAKVSLTPKSDILVLANGSRETSGQALDVFQTLGIETGAPVVVREFLTTPDRTLTNHFDQGDATVGFTHHWSSGSALVATGEISRYEQRTGDPDSRYACTGFDLSIIQALSSSLQTFPSHSYNVQLQQVTAFGRHQVIAGAQFFAQNRAQRCSEVVYDAFALYPLGSQAFSITGHDQAVEGNLRDEIRVSPRLHLTAGLTYQNLSYANLFGFFTSTPLKIAQWNPLGGAAIQLKPTTVLRIAGFRNLNSDTGVKIAPSTVSGFVIQRNEDPTAIRKEGDVSIEHGANRSFFGARSFVRDTSIPAFAIYGAFAPTASTRDFGMNGYYNLIAARHLGFSATDTVVHERTLNYNRSDNQVTAGVSFVHQRGFVAAINTSYITQRFSRTVVPELPRSSFSVTDLSFQYEFARKRGLFSLTLTNALDRTFQSVVDSVSVNPILPQRVFLAQIRWRL